MGLRERLLEIRERQKNQFLLKFSSIIFLQLLIVFLVMMTDLSSKKYPTTIK